MQQNVTKAESRELVRLNPATGDARNKRAWD